MKKRIYLFCNKEYGGAYYRVFQLFSREQPDFECYAVFSLKGRRGGRFRKFARTIRQFIKHEYINYERTNFFNNGLRVFKIEDVNRPEIVETISPGSIGFVAGFNQIFRKHIINKFSSFINFHPSLLPYYRGAIPSYWVIKNGETISGFTAHVIVEKIDAGEIVYQEMIAVNQGISEEDLNSKIAIVGSFYFSECLKAIKLGVPFRQSRINPQYIQKVDYVPAVREK